MDNEDKHARAIYPWEYEEDKSNLWKKYNINK